MAFLFSPKFVSSAGDTRDWRLPSVQPSMTFFRPELRNRAATLYESSMVNQMPGFHLNLPRKYLQDLHRDSTTFIVPKYPGVGDYQNFGGTLGRLRITERLAVDYGAFISAQYAFLLSSKQIVLGSNYLLQYRLTNKLQFQS
jgi:hypothetical protein